MNTDKTLDANAGMVRLMVTHMLDNTCPADAVTIHDVATGVPTAVRCTFLVDLHCVTYAIDAWKPIGGTDSHWRVTNYRVLSDLDGKVTP